MRSALCLYRQLGHAFRCRKAFAISPINQSCAASYTSHRMDHAEWRKTSADKPALIFYHYPCADGVFAALAATLFFQQQKVSVRYYPLEVYRQPDMAAMQLQANEVAYLLDYSGPDGFAQQLAQHVSHVIVLDHHKTAAAQLADTSSHPPNLHVHLDMQRSGAVIARDWFQPEGLDDQLQQMFQWVQDADLWTWKLPDSKAFHAGLAAQSIEYNALKNPRLWQQLQQLDVLKVLQDGQAILQRQELLIADALEKSTAYQLGGVQGLTSGWGCCLGVRIQGELIKFRSQAGNQLAQRSKELGFKPVGLIAYTEPEMPRADTHIKVSLRSIDGFDTSKISEAFGGGGHTAASSFIIPHDQLLNWEAMAPTAGQAAKKQLGAQLAQVIDSHVS